MQAKRRVASSTNAGVCPYAVMGAARNAPAKLGKAEDEDNGQRMSILISGGGTSGTAKNGDSERVTSARIRAGATESGIEGTQLHASGRATRSA
jgi:hypothetical protein